MTKNFLTVTDAAAYLQISKSSLYKLTMKRSLPFYQPNGGKVYFKEEDLINYIESSRVKTQQEIEYEAQVFLDQMQ